MANYERRIMGARRAWQIASEKSLDEMYRCVFGWEEPDVRGEGQPDMEEIEGVPPVAES